MFTQLASAPKSLPTCKKSNLKGNKSKGDLCFDWSDRLVGVTIYCVRSAASILRFLTSHIPFGKTFKACRYQCQGSYDSRMLRDGKFLKIAMHADSDSSR